MAIMAVMVSSLTDHRVAFIGWGGKEQRQGTRAASMGALKLKRISLVTVMVLQFHPLLVSRVTQEMGNGK